MTIGGVGLDQKKAFIDKNPVIQGKNDDWKDDFEKEIDEFYRENRQSPKSLEMKMRVFREIERIVASALPNLKIRLYPFGSTVTECGTNDSDLDIFMTAQTKRQKRYFMLGLETFLIRIHDSLVAHYGKDIESIEKIDAKVPIIKMSLGEKYEFLDIDFNASAKDGIMLSYLLRRYAILDERFPKLCLLIKEWAKGNGICDGAGGMLNSLSYQIMMLHYFQGVVKPPIFANLQAEYPGKFYLKRALDEVKFGEPLERLQVEDTDNTSSLTDLLIGFFRYYSNFPWSSLKVTTDGDTERRGRTNQDNIFVKDPFKSNSVSGSLKNDLNFKRVLYAFDEAYRMLSDGDLDLEDFLEPFEIPDNLDNLYGEKLKSHQVAMTLELIREARRERRRENRRLRKMNRAFVHMTCK